jgi:hypothetical protein
MATHRQLLYKSSQVKEKSVFPHSYKKRSQMTRNNVIGLVSFFVKMLAAKNDNGHNRTAISSLEVSKETQTNTSA